MNTVQVENQLRKKKVLKAAYIFIGIMLLLTFFSNTINNFSLPRASTEKPISGALIKEVTGEGLVQAREYFKVYADQGRIVEEVKGKVGDTVKKGQIIVILNKEELEWKLKEEQLKYAQMKAEYKKMTPEELQGEAGAEDKDVEVARKKVEAAEETRDKNKVLYEAGAISMEELKKSEQGALEAGRDLNTELEKLNERAKDMESKKYSLELQELKIEEIKRKLAEKSILKADTDGVIHEMNVSKGGLTDGSKPVFSIADMSKGSEIRLSVDEEKAKYLAVGDEAQINIKSMGEKQLKGTLREIRNNFEEKGSKKDLLIDVEDKGLIGGEHGEVYIGKKTAAYNTLVSNTAIGADDKGKFVWVLKERNGPIGSEFFVQRAAVTVGESDSSRTSILSGLSQQDSIVVKASKNLTDGSRVIPDK